MLKNFIKKVTNSRFAATPRVVICVPCGSTQVERRAIATRPKGRARRRFI